MASLYKRPDSKYWWVEYLDPAGKRRQKSTKLRRDVPLQTRKAREVCNELTRREGQSSPVASGQEFFESWVPRFIRQTYPGAEHELTRIRAEAAWRNIGAFLRENEVAVPRQLSRQHIRDFIEWREEAKPDLGVRKGTKNTALTEITFLRMIMKEAVKSGFASSNPCDQLGIGRDEPKLKPKITMKEHRLITRRLKSEPEWMGIAFKIAWDQGCRLTETHIRLPEGVDLARNVLKLRTKGKKKRVAEVPLSPRLKPLFRRLVSEKREFTFDMPKSPAKTFWNFFQRIGLGHLSFHSSRVTFITRCHEAGIPEETVMRLCLHASETVHRIYPRLPAASPHLQQAMKAVSGPADRRAA